MNDADHKGFKPASPVVAAIDVGTTSCKGLVVDASGEVVASYTKFNDTVFLQPGFAEQNPDAILASVVDLLKTIVDKADVSVFCFSAAMHSILAVDEAGTPLTRAMIWSDARSAPQSSRLTEQKMGQALYEVTGTPVHPMSPLCKLLWLKENERQVFEKAFKFISIKEYILFRLTGEFVVDHSLASATGMFDLEKKQWSMTALNLTGLTAARFSNTVPVTTPLTMRGPLAEQLKLAGMTIIIGASDGCLAQLGSHAMGSDDLSITIGTSGAVRLASTERKIDAQGKVFNYILDDDYFVCGGATNNGTALLNWYAQNIDSSATEEPAHFVSQIAAVPPGSDGLVFIPHIFGERAPIYDLRARGAFIGIASGHDKRFFQRALIEGICFQIRWIADCVQALAGDRKNYWVSGGFSRSSDWVQILSDVLGKPLTLRETHDASALGAAVLALRTLGVTPSMRSDGGQQFFPNEKTRTVYNINYTRFLKLYTALAATN